MTRERKTDLPLSVQRDHPGPFRRERRAFLLVGVFLALTASWPGARASQGQSGWGEDISPAGLVNISASGVSRSEARDYLERFGLGAGAVADPAVSVRGSDAFHGVQEARTEWAVKRLELNGKFASRGSTEVLGRAMTVTAVISSDGLLTTDDRGGRRTEAYRRFPVATCYRGPEGADCDQVVSFDAAWDQTGTIVEFIRDRRGFPSGVRFGEALALRYDFTPPLPEPPPPGLARARDDRWREPSSWELIDLRTSEIVIDSVDAARMASERPVLAVGLRGMGEALRVEGGQPFAVAHGSLGPPYAHMSLNDPSSIWRIVHASGDMSSEYHYRVDYHDDLVRVEIKAGEYGRSIVVEAPRSRDSAAPVSIVHPEPEALTDALRSGSRLRAEDFAGSWLESSFDKESLPIVLTPLDPWGLGVGRGAGNGLGASRAAARVEQDLAVAGMAAGFDFGPTDGCEVEADRVLCTGGASEVIGEESADPW
ncbi:MAG: hypothetical protein OXH28_14465 [bacterium]|nr:hypothetical protein [bacterium]